MDCYKQNVKKYILTEQLKNEKNKKFTQKEDKKAIK